MEFVKKMGWAIAFFILTLTGYSQDVVTCGRPTIKFYNLQNEIFAGELSSFIARVLSYGYVDTLCAVDYVIYHEEQQIASVSNYGSVSFSVRKNGSSYENVNITEGAGRLGFRYLMFDVYAATLGIFDGYCPGSYDPNDPNGGRNRPFTFNYSIDEYGSYRIHLAISRCSNAGNDIFQSFHSIADAHGCCDSNTHSDRSSGTCSNPVVIYECDVVFDVVSTKILEQPRGALVCSGESVPMSVSAQTNLGSELQYQWYKDGEPLPGENAPDFVATDEGVYYCAIDDGREIRQTDDAVVSYRRVDVDTVRYICNGTNSLEIVMPECDSYLWQDGTTDAAITVGEYGTYRVTLTNAGCLFEKEIVVSGSPDYDLIAEDSVRFCYNDTLSVQLVAGNFYDIVWNENPEYNQNPLVIRESGTYTVVAYEGGCPFADTLVAVRGENVNLVAEDTIRHCYGGLLVGLSVDNATNIVWCEGLVEGDSIYIGSQLAYYDVAADVDGCTYNDSFVEIGDGYPNTGLNNAYSYEIHNVDTVITIFANEGYDYLWGNGSTESYFAISCDTIDFPYSEDVFLAFTSGMGCEYNESFELTITMVTDDVPEYNIPAWSIAPNPNDGNFSIMGEEFDRAELYGSDGTLHSVITIRNCDLGWLPVGIYYIKVYSDGLMSIIRFSVAR